MSKTAAQPATPSSTKKTAAAKKTATPKPAASAVAAESAAAKKSAKTLTGKVVSAKMQKTITVAVERYAPHPMYGKYQRRTTKFLAHDENGECREGDTVAIEECRPISRHKAWRLSRVIERGEALVEAKP